jgi:hypothetical protein
MSLRETALTSPRPLSCPEPGLDTTFHALPFHCSISVLFCAVEVEAYEPTAQASVEESDATAASPLSPVPTFGVATTVQAEPFQRSAGVTNDVGDLS